MRREPKKKTSSWLGYLIFFLTIFVTVTVSLTLFIWVNRKTGGNRWLLVLVMMLIIVALSAICAGVDVIRRKIMIDRPVRMILSATEKIATGDFSVRLETLHEYEKYDDYDLIMENLNAMVAELKKNEVLKTDFISNVSHELKTPLAVIKNYTALLRVEKDEAAREKCLETVIQATERLNGLIVNILKLNKLENQNLKPEYEKIRLHDMLAEAVLAFEDRIAEKEIELECDFDEVETISSKAYLEIVWNNLLSNAVKFTGKGGKICVSVQKVSGMPVVSVSDTGVGISAETGARIFDKFYQGDTSHAAEGNGLGLALVKKVIDLIGGEISVRSEIGKGSTFTVKLK